MSYMTGIAIQTDALRTLDQVILISDQLSYFYLGDMNIHIFESLGPAHSVPGNIRSFSDRLSMSAHFSETNPEAEVLAGASYAHKC